MDGVWLLPTLNRVSELAEFFEAFRKTGGSTPGLVLVDGNDYLKNQTEYDALQMPQYWRMIKTTGVSMGDKVRETWDLYHHLDWVGILNDDHRPRTDCWDTKLISFLNGTNLVACNDGPMPHEPWNSPNRLAGAILFSGKFVRALGYIFAPGLHHFFSDDVWQFLAGQAQCGQVVMDVCVEHVHAYKHKEKQDHTFKIVNGEGGLLPTGEASGGFWPGDKATFERWLFSGEAEKALQRVIAIQPKQGLMIATPIHDSTVFSQFALGLLETSMFLSQQNIHFEFARVEGSSLLAHARNNIVDMFLKSKCKKLLFIDADQGFGKDQVLKLFMSDKPIIAGVTPHKRFPMNQNFEALPQDQHYFPDIANKSDEQFFRFLKDRANAQGEAEVNRAGTGFFMIDRSVFERMKPFVPEYFAFDDAKNAHIKHAEFFRMGVLDGKYRGEDWFFCTKAKELGIPIYIHGHSLVTHYGSFVYQINDRLRIA